MSTMSSSTSSPRSPTYAPPPFLLIPSNTKLPSIPSTSKSTLFSSYDSSLPSPSIASGSSSSAPTTLQQRFKAPAHAHAHALHSIPPREKSTRSLILDRTIAHETQLRVGAVRAELGWGVQPCGIEMKHQHEFYGGYTIEEEDEEMDEGRVRVRVPNVTLASQLHAKAQGVSKVLVATLKQPPHFHDHHPSSSPITLPNGVRFRLALAILADQAFSPPMVPAATTEVNEEIPMEVAPFVCMSSFRMTGHSNSSTTSTTNSNQLPSFKSMFPSIPARRSSTAVSTNSMTSFGASGMSSGPRSPLAAPFVPPSRPPVLQKKSMFTGSGWTSPQPSPVVARAASSPSPSTSTELIPTQPKSMDLRVPGFELQLPGEAKMDEKMNEAIFASAILHTNGNSICTRHAVASCQSPTCQPQSMRWLERSSTGGGLSLSLSSLTPTSTTSTSKTSTSMLAVLTHFLRLSALIITEMSDEQKDTSSKPRPGKAWYAVLLEVLTRATLEGYLMRGWKGTKAGEVLLGFGGGKGSVSVREEGEEPEMEPEGMKDVGDAYGVLFPGSVAQTGLLLEVDDVDGRRWFGTELAKRKREFLTTASSSQTPTLSAHLSALNKKYDTTTFDRFMVPFIESVSAWRGQPELSSVPVPVSASAKKSLASFFTSTRPRSRSRSSSAPPNGTGTSNGTSLLEHEPPSPSSAAPASKRARSVSLSLSSSSGVSPPMKRREMLAS